VLVEVTITTFSFVRLFQHMVKEAVIANTYELKQISLARRDTDNIDSGLAVPDNQNAGDFPKLDPYISPFPKTMVSETMV
jgi:hypothetical protein